MIELWKNINKIARPRRGQVALETLIVLAPWLIITTMFFNLLFLLGSLMLNQATVNRGALQIGALSCLPQSLEDELESRTGLGMQDLEVEAITPRVFRNPDGTPGQLQNWDRDQYLNNNGDIVHNPAQSRAVPRCDATGAPDAPINSIPSGNFIFLQARYQQRLLVLLPVALAGGDDTIDVHTNALTVSQALEGEG